jgi:putative heme-binding domain-containing protein
LIGDLTPEAVIAAVVERHGDIKVGAELLTRQTCVTCHTVDKSEPLRGPFLGAVATIYKRSELAEAILFPSQSIAQGFVTQRFELKDGTEIDGFVTLEAADTISVRNATGQEMVIPTDQVTQRNSLALSVMPEGLVANLNLDEFAALLDYLQSLAEAKPD